jgi:tRNA(Arg) A34 adenosine deaminase TadA
MRSTPAGRSRWRDEQRGAETNLVRRAWRQFDGETFAEATLYSSTEPCAMCAGAIVNCGIGRVVYSAPADRAREVGGRAAADVHRTGGSLVFP